MRKCDRLWWLVGGLSRWKRARAAARGRRRGGRRQRRRVRRRIVRSLRALAVAARGSCLTLVFARNAHSHIIASAPICIAAGEFIELRVACITIPPHTVIAIPCVAGHTVIVAITVITGGGSSAIAGAYGRRAAARGRRRGGRRQRRRVRRRIGRSLRALAVAGRGSCFTLVFARPAH